MPVQEYNWAGSEVTADLDLPVMYMNRSIDLGIDWSQYKSWPLVQLTQNYMLLQMSLLRQDNGMVWCGIIHSFGIQLTVIFGQQKDIISD